MWFYVIKNGNRCFMKSSKLFKTNEQAENEAEEYCRNAFALYGIVYSYYIDINLDGEL